LIINSQAYTKHHTTSISSRYIHSTQKIETHTHTQYTSSLKMKATHLINMHTFIAMHSHPHIQKWIHSTQKKCKNTYLSQHKEMKHTHI